MTIKCSQLLLLAYTAQCFVLLTANMKDIKKIASNFVSDSLAEKIAEFVMKATEQISDKNEDTGRHKNMNIRDISNESSEYDIRNIARQKEEKSLNTEQYNKETYKSKDIKYEEKEKQKYWSKQSKEMSHEKEDRLFDHEQKKWHKEVIEISNEPEEIPQSKKEDWRDKYERLSEKSRLPSRFSTTDREYWNKRDDDQNKISSDERSKFKYDEREADYKKQVSHPSSNFQSYYNKQPKSYRHISDMIKKPQNDDHKYSTTENQSVFSKSKLKTQYRPSSGSDEMLESDLKKKKTKESNFKISLFNSNEFHKAKFENLETKRYRSQFDVTTKKEKTDFDQYDNRNYPKAKYIATSGPVMLPRITTEKKEKEAKSEKTWWEKELPSASQLKTWLATQ